MRLASVTSFVLAVAVVSAGCLGGTPSEPVAPANDTPSAAPEATLDHDDHTQAAAPPEAVAALEANAALTSLHAMELYFTPDLALVDEVPEAGGVTFVPTFSKCFADPPCGYLTFATVPATEPWALVPGPVVYDLWVVADSPTLSTFPDFDFAIWFGTDVGQSTSATTATGSLLPGEPVNLVFESAHPETPNVVFPGDTFTALLLSTMGHDATHGLRLLTGGETPSKIRYTMARVDPAALVLGPETTESISGSLAGPGFPVAAVTGDDERTRAVHTFVVPETANLMRIDIVGRTPVGTPDIDVDLFFGDIKVSEGHTPRDTETMQLAGPALDGLRGRSVDLVVTDFFGAQVEYDVIVTYR